MSLHEQIKEGIKESMKSGDKVRLEVMRGISTAFTNELVATGKTPQDQIDDEQAIKVITRLAKQRKDSIEQFEKGGRADLVEEESKQLAVLSEFLPKQMERSELESFIKSKFEGLDNKDSSGKGIFMSSLMKELSGKAEGKMVKEIVDSLFI